MFDCGDAAEGSKHDRYKLTLNMTFGDSVKMKEKMLEIKEQSCRVLLKGWDIIMQIHFVPFDESSLRSQSLWADFRDEKWQFSDEGDS